jgi:hypothetical protein
MALVTATRRDLAELLLKAQKPSFVKAVEEKRFVLGLAYQAGRSPLTKRGLDGKKDFFTADELEKAAWGFLDDGGRQIGIEHIDGTVGVAKAAESFIWRWDPLPMTAVDGSTVLVKSGDWLLGAVCSPLAWSLVKSGQVTGWSPQGQVKRRTPLT